MNDFAWWMAQNAAVTALLVPVVLTACRMRRSRPAEQHLLWLLLLVKLVTPPLVQWPWPAGDFTTWKEFVSNAAAVASVSSREDSAATSPFVSAGQLAAATLPQIEEVIVAGTATFEPAAAVETRPPSSDGPPVEPALAVQAHELDWRTLAVRAALGLWLFGAAFVVVRIAGHARRQRATLRGSREAPPTLRRLVDEVSAVLGLRPVAVRVSSRTDSPFVSCLGRPVLVWPEALAADESLATARGVVAHELAHVRRRDHWVARLEALAAPLWWWNPVFWYVRRRLDETRELACDAVALESAPADRRALAELLLAFSASGRPALPFSPLRAGIAPRHSLRRRLAMLFDDSVSGRVSSVGLALAALLGMAALPGWVWGQEEPLPTPSADVPAAAPAVPSAGAPSAVPAAEQAPPGPASAESVPAAPLAPGYEAPAEPAQPIEPSQVAAPAAEAVPPAAPIGVSAPPSPSQPRQPTVTFAPPPSVEPAATGPAAAQSPNVRRVQFGEGKVVLLEPADDGVVLTFVENGRPGVKIYLNGVTFRSDGLGQSLDERRTHATPPQPPTPAEPELVPTARRPAGFEGRVTRRPAAVNSSASRAKFLEMAHELAMLEVEEKKVLLEQGREEAARQQQLFENGYSAERPRDLRLLEIDLKKAELKARQAAIELEAGRSSGF